MTTVVVDASVAIKWVAPEPDSPQALKLLGGVELVAPDLLITECANILWKKVHRGELATATAVLAADALARIDIMIEPTLPLFDRALDLAVSLRHPAYDCFYVALAEVHESAVVTSDARLVKAVLSCADPRLVGRVIPLAEAPHALGPA